MMSITREERMARTICAFSFGGFCMHIGGDLGCKNGRGRAPHWSWCEASRDQLFNYGYVHMVEEIDQAAGRGDGT